MPPEKKFIKMLPFLIDRGRIISKKRIGPGIYLFRISHPFVASRARPGQFVGVSAGNRCLRRPFSIFSTERDTFSIIFRVCGKGTKIIAEMDREDQIDIMGPLGTPFKMKNEKAVFIGGGMGIAPLYFLALRYPAPSLFIHGVVSENELMNLTPLEKAGHRVITVSQESNGMTAVDALKKNIDKANLIYTAGPVKMIKKVALLSLGLKKECYLSWEERMGCGTGLCQSCVIKSQQGYKLSCTEGPVFSATQVNWNEY